MANIVQFVTKFLIFLVKVNQKSEIIPKSRDSVFIIINNFNDFY